MIVTNVKTVVAKKIVKVAQQMVAIPREIMTHQKTIRLLRVEWNSQHFKLRLSWAW